MSRKYKTSVYIGRFQPIHNGHIETIKNALEESDKLIIFIGSSNKPRTVKNPFTTEQRIDIIKDSIKTEFGEELNPSWDNFPPKSITDRITFVPLRDYMYNDYKWASEVTSKAVSNGATMSNKTGLYGCLKDDSSYYLKMFPNWDLNIEPYRWHLDATSVREMYFEKHINGARYDRSVITKIPEVVKDYFKKWLKSSDSDEIIDEYEYLKSYHESWSDTPYPVTFTTVDSLVMCSGCVLLIKRGIELGKGQWALAGGFLNQNETIEDGALRELKEETDIRVRKDKLRENIQDVQVFDHPKRSLRGRIITHVHLIDLGYTSLPSIKGGDDANEAHWVPIADVMKMEDEFFEDHWDIIIQMTSKY